MKGLHHLLELLRLLAELAGRGVFIVRREVADGVVTPIVPLPRTGRAALNELMNGQELHGGHAQTFEVLDGSGVSHAGVSPAEILGDVRIQFRKALDVNLVDDCLVPRRARGAVVVPVEVWVRHHGFRHKRSAVTIVPGVLVTEEMVEDRLVHLE